MKARENLVRERPPIYSEQGASLGGSVIFDI